MPEPQLFQSARLKIKRAYEHIDQLNAAIDGFINGDFYDLVIQSDPDEPIFDVLKIVPKPVPDIMSLAAGDAIHNLMSALDHLMWESVYLGTGETPSERLQFPIRRNYEELVGAIQGTEIEGAHLDIVWLILNDIAPYDGGNDPLRSLHKMDRADKHRLLIPIVAHIAVRDVLLENERGETFAPPFLEFGSVSDQPTAVAIGKGLRAAPNGRWTFSTSSAKVKDKGKATAQVLFGIRNPLGYSPPLPTLHQLAQLVAGIVDQFEQTLLT